MRERRTRPLVAVVGAGEVVHAYWLPAISASGRNAIIFDVSAERAAAAARNSHIVVAATTVAELVEARPQVVVVATPPSTHLAVIEQLAAVAAATREPTSRLRVLLEKPPFLRMADVNAAVKAAEIGRLDLRSAFIRRAFPAIASARVTFAQWVASFGPLCTVDLWEGRPHAWSSRAVQERGLEGLDHPLEDELTHALDALFCVSSMVVDDVVVSSIEDTTFEHRSETFLRLSGQPPVTLRITCSRTRLLSNRMKLTFTNGSAALIEMLPIGGVAVVSDTSVELLHGPTHFVGVRAALASMMSGDSPAEVPLEEWRSPLRIIEALRTAQ